MKLKQIVIATSLAMAAGQALAIPALPPIGQQLFVSGSSAGQPSLGLIIESLCQPNAVGTPIHVFYSGAAAPFGGNHRAYLCTTKATVGTPLGAAGKPVLINNRAQGGSAFGINPVADTLPIVRMLVDNTCVPAIAALPGVNVAVVPLTNQWTCPNVTAGVGLMDIPDAGVSDVEPAIFKGPHNLPPAFPLVAKNLVNITPIAVQAVGFNTPVTLLVNTPKPSLTRAQVTSLITGAYGSWTNIATSPPAAAPALVNKPVVICRRQAGSGSQAVINNYFMGFPCVGGAAATPLDHTANPAGNPLAIPALLPVGGSGTYIIENASSSAVINCLDQAGRAAGLGTVTDVYGVTFNFPAGGASAAIGVLGLEVPPPPGSNWIFENIDGVFPSTDNMMNGSSMPYGETTFQSRVAAASGGYCSGGLNSGHLAPCAVGETLVPNNSLLKNEYLAAFAAAAGDPVIIATANVNGVAALATNSAGTAPILDAFGNVTNRVMKGTVSGNTCSSQQLYY